MISSLVLLWQFLSSLTWGWHSNPEKQFCCWANSHCNHESLLLRHTAFGKCNLKTNYERNSQTKPVFLVISLPLMTPVAGLKFKIFHNFVFLCDKLGLVRSEFYVTDMKKRKKIQIPTYVLLLITSPHTVTPLWFLASQLHPTRNCNHTFFRLCAFAATKLSNAKEPQFYSPSFI